METLLITVSLIFVSGLIVYYRYQKRRSRFPMIPSEDPFKNYPVSEFEE